MDVYAVCPTIRTAHFTLRLVRETGVLRIDLASKYEQRDLIRELLTFARTHFRAWFGNAALVTKAIPAAAERRAALEDCGWSFMDEFRTCRDCYRLELP